MPIVLMKYKASMDFKGAVGALGLHTNWQKLLLLPCSNNRHCLSKAVLLFNKFIKKLRFDDLGLTAFLSLFIKLPVGGDQAA